MSAADVSRSASSHPSVTEGPVRFRPGRKGLAVFVLLSVAGTLVWFADRPYLTSGLVGFDVPDLSPDALNLGLFFVPVVCGALALASGFLFPQGFWLWGIALALHAPFTEGLTVYFMYQEGIELAVADRPGELIGYAVLVAMLIAFAALCYTTLSALGMGLRYMAGRILSR